MNCKSFWYQQLGFIIIAIFSGSSISSSIVIFAIISIVIITLILLLSLS